METLTQFGGERRVEINFTIVRTIERPHRALRGAACGSRTVTEHYQARPLIGYSLLRQNLGPLHVGSAKNLGDELSGLIRRRAGGALLLRTHRLFILLRWMTAAEDFGSADQNAWINNERPAENSEHQEGADAKSTAVNGQIESARAAVVRAAVVTATILDIVALRQVIQAH